MKKIILSAAIMAFSTILFAQKKVADVAKFASETIDQGKLKQNNPVPVKFIVTNIGQEPLIIEQATPTCGCTMGDYTKTPIAPGASGFITATFNAANLGHFDKHLTVKFAGVEEVKSITITGDVLSAEDYAKLKPEEIKTADTPKPALSNVSKTKPAVKKPVRKVTKPSVSTAVKN